MASRVLVANGSDGGRKSMAALLTRLGYEVQTAPDDGFLASLTADNLPDLIVIDEKLKGASGRETLAKVRAMPVGKQLVVLMTVGERSRLEQLRIALEVGANDAIDRRAREVEMGNRVRVMLGSARDGEAPKELVANTSTIVSARGGSGKTVLACNLAVALARYPGQTVALLDLNLEFGTTHTILGLQPTATLSEIAKAATEDTTDEAFDALLLHHSSGVRLLPAVAQPGDSELLSDQTVMAMLNRLRRTYDHLIIDGRPSYREFMIDLWDLSDSLVIPCPADVPSVGVTRALMGAFDRVDVATGKILVVVNNIVAKPGLSAKQIERFLGHPVLSVPYGGEPMQDAVNKGRPYVLEHPSSPTSLGIRNLADQLLMLHSGGAASR